MGLPLSLYRVTAIRKRNSRKLRIIHAPCEELKEKQRLALTNEYRTGIGPGPYSMAFVRGRGIVDHAKPHVGKKYVIRIDISDFFHSVRPEHVIKAWKFEKMTKKEVESRVMRGLDWQKAPLPVGLIDLAFIQSPTDMFEECLPQGGPLSGYMANLAMKKVDFSITRMLRKRKIPFSYTRYADDIVLSSDSGKIFIYAMKSVPRILALNGFRINRSKFKVMRTHRRQSVCGIVVNKKMSIPKDKRHEIRGRVHNVFMDTVHGKPVDLKEVQYLDGYLAFARGVDRPWAEKHLERMKMVKTILKSRK